MTALRLLLVAIVAGPPPAPDPAVRVYVTSTETTVHGQAITVTASPAEGPGERVAKGGDVGGVVDFRLAPGLWFFATDTDGYWSEPRLVFVTQDTEITLQAWPEAVLEGRLAFAPGIKGEWPRSIAASIRLPDGGATRVYSSTEVCEVEGARWRCILPATRLDIRLKPEGFVPRYFHDERLSATSPKNVGAVLLEKGASIAGRVVDPEGKPVTRARAQLAAADGTLLGATKFSPSDRNGYFQLTVAGAGRYVARISDGARSGASSAFEIRDDDELQLNEPIVLRRPLTLTVRIRPFLDVDNGRWRLDLVRIEGMEARPVFTGAAANAEGTWVASGLSPGAYRLAVSTSMGLPWLLRDIGLATESQEVEIDTAACMLVGTLRLGERAIGASIVLHGFPDIKVSTKSDDSGAFEARMPCVVDPAKHEWQADISGAGVRRSVRRVEAQSNGSGGIRLDIGLPDSSVDVLVQDEKGVPAPRAVLTVAEALRPDRIQITGDVDPDRPGYLKLRGLDDGRYSAWARAPGDEVSEPVAFEISKSSRHARLQLTVRRQLTVEGIVVAEDGVPVPSATVMAVPAQDLQSPVRPAVSDASGRFTLKLPHATRTVVLASRAYGRVYKIERVDLQPAQPLVVRLERDGGTLVLESDEPLASENTTYVLRQGGFSGTGSLHAWSRLHGQASSPTTLTLPGMAPGAYLVCRLRMTETASLLTGHMPSGRCVAGSVTRGGETRLEVPTATGSN